MFAMCFRGLPKAMAVFPVAAASVMTTSSGSDVPNAMIVDPIRAGEMLYRRARPLPPSTKRPAPLMRSAIPMMNVMAVSIIETSGAC